MSSLPPLKLNLCCGLSKYEDYVNIDKVADVKPDLVLDITREKLPYGESLVNEVLLSHAIEHIEKKNWDFVFLEILRVLCPGGFLYVLYPEFERVARNWLDNAYGKREYWEKCIYGRQAHPGDFHVSLMHTPDFINYLREDIGFVNICSMEEEPPNDNFNTIVRASKSSKPVLTREDIVKDESYVA